MNRLLHIGKSAFRTIWMLVNLGVAALTVISAYCGYIPPEKITLAQVVNMLFPGFALLCALLFVADLFIYRKSMLAAAAGIVLSSGPLLDIFPLNVRGVNLTDEEEKRTFTLLTYNAYNFVDNQGVNPDRGNRTLAYILSTDADIVCIQEGGNITGKKHGVGSQEQRDSIRHRYPYIIDTPAHAGEMLLSKYPATLIPTPQPEWGTGKYSAYSITVDSCRLMVVNCHLQSIGLTPDDKEVYRELTDKELKPTRRELSQVKTDVLPKLLGAFRTRGEQARHIKQFVDSVNATNVILVGDFNDVAGSYAYRTIKNMGFKDAYAQRAFGPTITYNTSRFYFHIDQVFYKGDLRAVDIMRGKTKSSDHYPLLATFVWDFPDTHHDN